MRINGKTTSATTHVRGQECIQSVGSHWFTDGLATPHRKICEKVEAEHSVRFGVLDFLVRAGLEAHKQSVNTSCASTITATFSVASESVCLCEKVHGSLPPANTNTCMFRG